MKQLIRFEEVRDQINGKYSVVNHTKTNTDRYVPIPDKALEVIKQNIRKYKQGI